MGENTAEGGGFSRFGSSFIPENFKHSGDALPHFINSEVAALRSVSFFQRTLCFQFLNTGEELFLFDGVLLKSIHAVFIRFKHTAEFKLLGGNEAGIIFRAGGTGYGTGREREDAGLHTMLKLGNDGGIGFTDVETMGYGTHTVRVLMALHRSASGTVHKSTAAGRTSEQTLEHILLSGIRAGIGHGLSGALKLLLSGGKGIFVYDRLIIALDKQLVPGGGRAAGIVILAAA